MTLVLLCANARVAVLLSTSLLLFPARLRQTTPDVPISQGIARVDNRLIVHAIIFVIKERTAQARLLSAHHGGADQSAS
jgi:hypothetical protein